MSRECETYSVKCVRMNPCNEGTLIGIVPTVTETLLGVIEFNGAWKEFGIEATEGEEIAILTSLLNENYVHELKLYDEVNELIGCYKLHTLLTMGVADAPVPPVASGSWGWITLSASGNTLVSDYLTGEITDVIFLDGNSTEWADNGITHDANTGTLDFTAIGGFTGDVGIWYRNLNP